MVTATLHRPGLQTPPPRASHPLFPPSPSPHGMQLLPPSPQNHTRDPQERTGQPTVSPRGKLRHSTASDNQVEGGGPRQPHRPPALSTLGCWWDTLPPPKGKSWAQTRQHHSGHPHSLPHPKAPAVTWGADEVDQSSAGRILPCSPSPQRPQSHRHRCQHSILLTKAPPPTNPRPPSPKSQPPRGSQAAK